MSETTILFAVVALQLVYAAYAIVKIFQLRDAVPEKSKYSVSQVVAASESASEPPPLPGDQESAPDEEEVVTNDESSASEEESIAAIEIGSVSETFTDIVRDLNEYALTNRGSASDFAIVKDAVDRPLDAMANRADARVTTPLYLGLAGALVGIVVGVREMSKGISSAADNAAVGTDAAAGLDGIMDNLGGLLNAVGWAMGASLGGVVLTIVLSLLTRWATATLDERRDEFLTFYQVKFLPRITKDINSVLSSLNGALSAFNDKFVVNVGLMQESFRENSEAVKHQALVLQQMQALSTGEALDNTVQLYESVSRATARLEQLDPFVEKTHANLRRIGEAADSLARAAGAGSRLAAMADDLQQVTITSREVQEYVGRHLKDLNIASDEAESTTARILREFKENQQAFRKDLNELNSSLLRVTQDIARSTTEVVETASASIKDVPEKVEGMIKESFHTNVVDRVVDSGEKAAAAAGSAENAVANSDKLRRDIQQSLFKQDREISEAVAQQTVVLKEVIGAMKDQRREIQSHTHVLEHMMRPWYKKLFGIGKSTIAPK